MTADTKGPDDYGCMIVAIVVLIFAVVVAVRMRVDSIEARIQKLEDIRR